MTDRSAPLKIAHVVRRFAFEEWGGTETVVWNSARELVAHGVASAIYATRACSAAGDEVREGIPIRRFPYFYPNWPLSAERIRALDKKGGNPVSRKLLRALRESDCDLIHIHTAGRLAQGAILDAKRRRVPTVVSFHGGCRDVPEAEVREMLRPLRHTFPYGGLYDRLTGRRIDIAAAADALICVGANEEALLRRQYPEKKIIYLPNGIDPDRMARPVGWDFRQKYGIPAERLLLLCIARIDYQKNQLALLRAAAMLRDRGEPVQVVMIGPVSAEWYAEEMRALIAEEKLSDHVLWLPGVPAEDELLPAALKAADFFVLPSLHEPFGIAVLEAWSAGVPVIAAQIGGLRHLIREGENGRFCDPERPASIADTVERCRRAPEETRLMAERARREVAETYAWTKIAARLADFYREVKNGYR